MIREAQRRNKTANKHERNRFIPFANERDSIGNIIRVKNEKKNDMNAIKIFQNLKKSTKEYIFDKYFEKMVRRFQMFTRSITEHQIDYEKQFQKLHVVAESFLRQREKQKQNEDQYYMYSKAYISQKMQYLKSHLKSIKDRKKEKDKKMLRIKSSNPKGSEINVNLFSTISNRSKLMASFVNEGKKYKHFVDQKNINSWQRWYSKKSYEVFPGKDFTIKRLQKSLYD